MAIKIGGTSIIDDNKNISNVGIVTVGTGGTTGKLNVGTGATIDGAGNAYLNGNLTINGQFFVGGGSISTTGLLSFYPQEDDLIDNSQFDAWVGIITMTFSRNVGIATTSSMFEIRKTSPNGNLITVSGISSVNYVAGDLKKINVIFSQSGLTTDSTTIFRYHPIIPSDAIYFTDNNEYYPGINSGDPSEDVYSFNFRASNLGEFTQGGYLICRSGGTSWIVAPQCTETGGAYDPTKNLNCVNSLVSNQWSCNAGGWFIPTCAQLLNPGQLCRTYWDAYACVDPCDTYYASTNHGNGPWAVDFNSGNTIAYFGCAPRCHRAFRCITY